MCSSLTGVGMMRRDQPTQGRFRESYLPATRGLLLRNRRKRRSGGPEDGSGSSHGSSPARPRAALRRSGGAPMAEPPVDLDEAVLQPLAQTQGAAAQRTSSPRSSGPAPATCPKPSSRRTSAVARRRRPLAGRACHSRDRAEVRRRIAEPVTPGQTSARRSRCIILERRH